MAESNWVCYILKSVDSNKTYVGATDNLYRRLCDHNGLHGISKGAKATKGQMWYVAFCVSGFPNKIACLSFESGLRRIKRRKCKHFYKYKYGDTTIMRRIVDLYNLLYVGSPLKKWNKDGLIINWLEPHLRPSNNKLPIGVGELLEFSEMSHL